MILRMILCGAMALILGLAGCAPAPLIPVAGLTPLAPDSYKEWGVPKQLTLQGEGNSYQVLTGETSHIGSVLELAAGGKGYIEYFQRYFAGKEVLENYRLQFLSTQGVGRIKLSALNNDGEIIGTVGLVYTGDLPADTLGTKWLDRRYMANYVGTWLEARDKAGALFARYLPELDLTQADQYQMSVEVGRGQHALITKFNFSGVAEIRQVRITPLKVKHEVVLGNVVTVEADVENIGKKMLTDLSLKLAEPKGYGLIVRDNSMQNIDKLEPGGKRRLSWQVKAQRPDGVNFNRPWQLAFVVNGAEVGEGITVAVNDPRPGKVFYVMTEDLEPIDSAGYPVPWGNGDGWLEPEEFQVQMVDKARKLNEIAGEYGAKWTHYIAWTAVRAAEWAAGKSSGDQWARTVKAIKQSVREQTSLGHEYAIHMHADYDPYLAGNVLSYNPVVDGLWANHLHHGWAHSLANEGNFNDYNTRTGTLYAYQRLLGEMSAPQGPSITARAGSFDFGSGNASEAMSTRSYQGVGLWGSSDADGNQGGVTAGNFGQEIYFAQPDNINTPANDLASIGLVEFRPTPQEYISYDNQTAAVMNAKADVGIAEFTANGVAKPGVHAIVGFTHAMFIMGAGDWKSTNGGQFSVIDEHLRYLKEHYVAKGRLTFATASELVKAYLDYYSPGPVAICGTRLSRGFGVSEYTIDILGRDIPMDALHPHEVSVKYPLYLRDSAYKISIFKNGQEIFFTWRLPTPSNNIGFTVDDSQATYTLKVYHEEYIYRVMTFFRGVKAKVSKYF